MSRNEASVTARADAWWNEKLQLGIGGKQTNDEKKVPSIIRPYYTPRWIVRKVIIQRLIEGKRCIDYIQNTMGLSTQQLMEAAQNREEWRKIV